MRYLKALMLALLFVVSMLFFVQNNGPMSTSLQLEFNLVTLTLYSFRNCRFLRRILTRFFY